MFKSCLYDVIKILYLKKTLFLKGRHCQNVTCCLKKKDIFLAERSNPKFPCNSHGSVG